MKVIIGCDRRVKVRGSDEYKGGWYYREELPRDRDDDYADDFPPKSSREPTYDAIKQRAIADGHEISMGGWKHKLLSWNWHAHAMDGCPGWEIENPSAGTYERHPAFVKLTHHRVSGADVESSVLANAWDDLAQRDFYQRDWTSSGIPFCSDGERYWSGWWFASLAERARFLEWCRMERGLMIPYFATLREACAYIGRPLQRLSARARRRLRRQWRRGVLQRSITRASGMPHSLDHRISVVNRMAVP